MRGYARELDGDPAEMLLAGAALERAYRRGGAGSTTAAVPTPAPDDVRFTLPESSSAHLLSMLAAKATLLDEWFAVALEHNYRAPDHLVAELLFFARASEAHRESILQIVGERGRWLAAQKPRVEQTRPNQGCQPGRVASRKFVAAHTVADRHSSNRSRAGAGRTPKVLGHRAGRTEGCLRRGAGKRTECG